VRFVRKGLAALVLAALVTTAFAEGPAPGLQTTELGAGDASIVFLHGFGGTRLDWLPLAKRLKDRFRLVMVELPGFGTNPLPDPFSLEAAADQVAAVIAAQKPGGTIVVGQGLGGFLALRALARHPGHARGLVLIDAALKSPIPVEDQMVQRLVKFMDDDYGSFSNMAFSKMGHDSAESAILFAKMAAVQPATVKAYMRNLLRADANGDLKSLDVPVELLFTGRMWPGGETWGEIARKFGYEDTTVAVPHRLVSAGTLVAKDQPDSLADLLSAYAAERLAAAK